MGVTRKILNWYARIGPRHGKSNPPFEHVVQIGDPRLRKVCDPVPLDKIKTAEIQTVIKKLELVLKKYCSFGMSAPQVGMNLRLFVMRVTLDQLSKTPKAEVEARDMEEVPFTVFINPKLKVLDYTKLTFSEGCESVQGYTADVARFRQVEVSGYNEQGDPTTKVFANWAARIAQHEVDHLDGKIYIDSMEKKSFTCLCWEEVNLAKGKLVLPFCPN